MRIAALILGFLLCTSCNAQTKQADATEVPSLETVLTNPETVIVDVRVPEQFQKEAAKGAINIPLTELPKRANELRGKKNIVLYCNTGRQAGMALDILKKEGINNVYNAINVANIRSLQHKNSAMINLKNEITFNTDKPSVYHIRKNDKIRYFAVALGKDALLKKHTAPVPSTLVVLKGEISFVMESETIHLKEMDVYEIPVNVEHEVRGLQDENLFTVTQEL